MWLSGKRPRDRPKRKLMNEINENMKIVGVTVEDASDRTSWRKAIFCAIHQENPKEEGFIVI